MAKVVLPNPGPPVISTTGNVPPSMISTTSSCHVEHHLFPRLSDNMCLKIKPVVSTYLKSNGLPYHEAPYLSLLWKFYNNYDELMVKAPPITELIGIQ